MEIADETLVFPLLGLGLLVEPRLKLLSGVCRELAVLVDLHHLVEYDLGRFQSEEEVGQRRHERSHRANEVGVGEHLVAQARRVVAELYPRGLDDVANLDAMRASHLASFAVEAELQCLVEEVGVFQAIAQQVGTGMLRARVFRLHGRHWAIRRADAALQALLVVVFAEVS